MATASRWEMRRVPQVGRDYVFAEVELRILGAQYGATGVDEAGCGRCGVE